MSTPEIENSTTLPSEHSSHPESIGGDDNVQVLPSSDSQNQNESSTVGSSKKRKERSKVWDTFEKLKVDGVNDKAECKNCKRKLSANSKNGTKHLLEHQIRCPARKTMDLKQFLLVANMAADVNMQLQNHNFDPELARLNLAYMIIMHEYPLQMVEHKWFKVFLSSLQPLFKPISRNTLRADITKIFAEEKKNIMSVLESCKSRIAITSDMWTSSNQKKRYMTITAHFIDNSWKLQSRIVRFAYVPCPHMAEVIVEVLFECLLDWNIDRKLSTLTLDNCTTNDSVATMLSLLVNRFSPNTLLLGGKILHMRCAAHILNLIVKDGLEAIGDSIERIRDSVYYWTATPKRVERFEETVRQLHIKHKKKLAQDVKTRWNSTYLMLNGALLYASVFPRLKQRDPEYRSLPTEHDSMLAREICERLEFFYVLTEMFSATSCPTANKIFIYICEIRLKIDEWHKSEYVAIKLMVANMIAKLKKYWEDIHTIFSIALILDPRFKFRTIDYYFDKIYKDQAEFEKEKVRTIMHEIENEYKASFPKPKGGSGNSTSSCLVSNVHGSNNIFEGIQSLGAYFSRSTIAQEKYEFDSYMEEPLLPNDSDFDILTWWKTQGVKHPTLHLIARDIFAIPVSTVASEAAFSTSGRFVNKHRSRLIPETLEALMCSQDWLWERLDVEGPSSKVVNGVTSYSSDEDEEDSVVTALF